MTGDLVNLVASLALDRAGDKIAQHAIRMMLEYLCTVEDEALRGHSVSVAK